MANKKNKKHLFSKPISFGIAPGEHVVHIIGQTNAQNEVDIRQDMESPHRYNTVSQAEAYSSPSDLSYGEEIVGLATKLDEYYSNTKNPEFKEYLLNWKEYLTTGSRSKQQEAFRKLSQKAEALKGKYEPVEDLKVRNFMYGEEAPDIHADARDSSLEDTDYDRLIGNYIKHLEDNYLSPTNGFLSVDREVDKKSVTEPSFSGASGFFSVWRDKSKDALFPHLPSPNDIKQGIGLEDCYMLSALTQIAAKDPGRIRDMMKDNGNGTVTVQFYEPGDDGKRVPVYIDVLKTESRIMGVGANSYASSSLWVQMMEKAYAKYVDRQNEKAGVKAKGLSGISRSNTASFMNAISKDEKYEFAINDYGFSGDRKKEYEKADKNAYTVEEEMLHTLFRNKCGLGSDVITVGSGATGDKEKDVKSHGIRTGHAYTVLDAFEKVVDGQKKLFVRLRDPYATFSAGYDEEGNLKDTSSLVSGTYNAGTDNMGTFNMEMTDFMKHFDQFSGISNKTHDQYTCMLNLLEKSVGFSSRNKVFNYLKNPEADPNFIDELYDFAITYRSADVDSPLRQQISGFFGNYFTDSVERNEKNRLYNELKDSIASFKEEKAKAKATAKNKPVEQPKKEEEEKYILETIDVDEYEDMDYDDFEEKPLTFQEQMAQFYKELKSNESSWKNSSQYYNLEKAVDEASKCKKDNLVEKANEVMRCALEYNIQKDKTGFDKLSEQKLKLVDKIANFASNDAALCFVSDYRKGPKPLEKKANTKEKMSLKDAEKEEGKRDIGKTSKTEKKDDFLKDFEIM